MDTKSILQFSDGSVVVLDERGNVHGPFKNDDDAQFTLHILREEGIKASALQIIGTI